MFRRKRLAVQQELYPYPIVGIRTFQENMKEESSMPDPKNPIPSNPTEQPERAPQVPQEAPAPSTPAKEDIPPQA